MDYPIRKRTTCSVCGLDTLRHTGWFLVSENRWLDRLTIFSWHPTLARQREVQSVCCRQHLKTLVEYWLTEASLHFPPAQRLPRPKASGPNLVDADIDIDTDEDFGLRSAGRMVGELAVYRESFSSLWSGSPEDLESILDAIVGTENKPRATEFQLFDPPKSWHELSLQ